MKVKKNNDPQVKRKPSPVPDLQTPQFITTISDVQFDRRATSDESEKKSSELIETVGKTESGTIAELDRVPKESKFDYKLNLDVNPFSIPSGEKSFGEISKSMESKKLQSLVGMKSSRRELAKRIVMRDKSVRNKRLTTIKKSRTIANKARTESRVDLQMKLRNINETD